MKYIYATTKLCSFMVQPYRNIMKIYETISLIPDNNCMRFSIKKMFKDQFDREARGYFFICHRRGDNFFMDITGIEDISPEDIMKKPTLKMTVDDKGSFKLSV